MAVVTNTANGECALAKPVDWAPHQAIGVADLSPGFAQHLDPVTEDEVIVRIARQP